MQYILSNLSQIAWAGRWKNLTVPTINFPVPQELSEIPFWVYAGIIEVNSISYSAAIHYGPIPTFSDSTPRLETNLIDVTGISFPQETIFQLTLIEKIREIKLFENPESLRQQILIDIGQIREILQKK